ncbi:MAG: TSUP family transporter [Alphaproteobacteria bacterium]|nr:TSUP family transporter [Alphaproteobacteria bacterium]
MFETIIAEPIATFLLIGFVAQLIDGALGMAYGVASTTALIAVGVPPALASANVHAAETATTAVSGLSHGLARNVDWKILRRLAPAGVIGGILGAAILAQYPMEAARPVVAAYLLAMGLIVIRKGLQPPAPPRVIRHVASLGLVGGFCDAVGGGGWGPVVTSNLIARGGDAGRMIGTVNCAEFFMTAAATATFWATMGPVFGEAAVGLLLGGVAAAPIAAVAAKRAPRRALMVLVGSLIVALSGFNIYRSFS